MHARYMIPGILCASTSAFPPDPLLPGLGLPPVGKRVLRSKAVRKSSDVAKESPRAIDFTVRDAGAEALGHTTGRS